MKKLIILILLIVPLVSFGQEKERKTKKGKVYINKIGNDVYQSSITGKSGFSGQNRFLQRSNTEKLKTKALGKAEDFAKEKNAELEVIGFEKTEQTNSPFPKAILKFRLVYDSNRVYKSNDQNKITIPRTKTDLKNNPQSVVKIPSSEKENFKDKAIKEIKQLKELLDSGILTQEEYNKKAAALKKIILGN